MSAKKSASNDVKATTVVANPDALEPKFKYIGGSQSDDWNHVLINQVLNTVILHANEDFQGQQRRGTAAALVGIGPKDEIEGMIGAQLLAAHNAAMECYWRAMTPEQSFEGKRENLNQANKLSRTHTKLLEALNRHRGKGQQKVTVEHVHVHSGGQAVVGMVEALGGGDRAKSEGQPHAKQIAHAPQPPVRSEDAKGEPVSVTGDAKRSVSDARRKVTRRSKRKS